ncbi:uncharacterized protein LOC142231758 [Haematobia irritans]|uniref:uncharacterized protein LOC142231758 n=1 Tax=Haematobia irritans TaxID=7368 RepID=UPI003F4F8185
MEGRAHSSNEVREVLDKYLELFHQSSSIDIKYHLAPNSVIDWYGRTVRGANKIHDYLRHEVISQYEHVDFSEPEVCSPIETKTSHMRTKIISTKPIDHVHPINRVPDMVPLKSYADSDVEDNDHMRISSSRLLDVAGGLRKTPEKCTSTLTMADLTPPASAVKDTEPQSTETDEEKTKDDEDAKLSARRQQLKRSYSGHFSYLKRLPTAPSTSKRAKDIAGGIRTLLDDSSSEEDELEVMEALYTPLRYLEVTGLLRIRATSSGKQRSALWRDRTELETRIRISYRRKLEDNQLQFALIIYESLNGDVVATPTRRNLMSQFALSTDETAVAAIAESSEQQANERNAVEPILTVPAMTSLPSQNTTFFDNEEDPLQEETSLEALSVANLRTPTKFTHTPPATPKRKPRSLMGTASGQKRLNNSPQAPTPKRSAARSLRL